MKNKAFIMALVAAFALSGCGKGATYSIQGNNKENAAEVIADTTGEESAATEENTEENTEE